MNSLQILTVIYWRVKFSLQFYNIESRITATHLNSLDGHTHISTYCLGLLKLTIKYSRGRASFDGTSEMIVQVWWIFDFLTMLWKWGRGRAIQMNLIVHKFRVVISWGERGGGGVEGNGDRPLLSLAIGNKNISNSITLNK